MKAAFPCMIGMAADPDHAKGGTCPWQGRIKTDLPVHLGHGVVNDLGKPKGGAVEAEDDGELGEAKNPNSLGTKGILQAEGVFARGEFAVLFDINLFKDKGLFCRGQPMGVFRSISEEKGYEESEKNGGSALQYKEPLPRVKPVPSFGNLKNPA